MFSTASTTATRPVRNTSTSSSNSTSGTPCTHPQSDEEDDTDPAAKDAAKDNEVPKGLRSSNPAHMRIIDKLRDLSVDKLVPLPQLVVVGDQSKIGRASCRERVF